MRARDVSRPTGRGEGGDREDAERPDGDAGHDEEREGRAGSTRDRS
jgi:hypothetical protein